MALERAVTPEEVVARGDDTGWPALPMEELPRPSVAIPGGSVARRLIDNARLGLQPRGMSAGQRADRWAPAPSPRVRQKRRATLQNNRFNRLTLGTILLGDEWASLQRVRIPDRILGQFARNLGTMYAAGVPLGRGIGMMTDQSESLEWGLVVAAINRDLQNGKSLIACFGSFPNIFGPTWMALMRRAMEDGSLGETLHALADMHDRADHLRSRIRAVCTYPLIVFAMSVVIAFGAFLFLLPQVLGFIVASGRPIPLLTQALIFGMNIVSHPLFLVELPILAWFNVYAFRRFVSTERGRLRLDHLKCVMPVVGPLFRKIAVARLMHSLKATVGSGVRITLALELAGAACGNALYRLHMLRCAQALRDGERLSSMFAPPTRLYDPMVFYSLEIGEECGQLDRMIETLAQYHDLEVSNALDNLLTLLEPMLILGTGLLVAVVVLAIFLPLYGVVGALV